MKRKLTIITALILVIVMLFSGCTSSEAATQLQMMVSFRDNEIGEVTHTPICEDGEVMPCGINVVRFIFERPAIKLEEGSVTIYNYDDDTVFQSFVFEANQTEYNNVNIFSDPETNGTIFELGLDGMFDAGTKYYIEATEGLFGVNGEGYENISSPAYGGKDVWNVEIAPYGISGFEGTLEEIGDTRTFNVEIGGEVTRVEVTENDDDIVTIEPEVLTESGDVTITVNATGYSIVRFSFLDADDEQVQQLESAVYIEEKEE